jgi:serine/threonine protein kinase
METMAEKDSAYAETLAHTGPPAQLTHLTQAPLARSSAAALGLSTRSTVLPRSVRVGDSHEVVEAAQRFVPVRVLGTGGLGEVTLVQDNDIHRSVALKRLRGEVNSDELVHRFAQEIRTVGQLEHPNIAPVHDVGIDDEGRHYFVMRYIEGETLEHVIAKLAEGDDAYHARFPFEHRVQVFLGVLNAIAYAHGKQIIHRDIKPSNIMVGPFGEVVVMDWGIAKKRDATEPVGDGAAPVAHDAHEQLFLTRHGSLVGTPAYMSPEQAMGATDRIDERSDVYALCVVLYELLSLQHYLPGRSTVPEMLSAVADDVHVKASFVTSAHQTPVPAELGWFIEKGLEKDPDARYQSVNEMIATLEHAMAGAFPVQCPVTFLKRVGSESVRFVDRHPLVSMAGTASVVGLAVFGFVEILLRFV